MFFSSGSSLYDVRSSTGTSAFGSASTTSARPPVFENGSPSDATNKILMDSPFAGCPSILRYGRAHGPATADGASTPPTLPLSIRTEQATPLRACWLWQTQRPANARNLFYAPALLRDSVDQFPRFFTTPPQTTSSDDMFRGSPGRKSPVGCTN